MNNLKSINKALDGLATINKEKVDLMLQQLVIEIVDDIEFDMSGVVDRLEFENLLDEVVNVLNRTTEYKHVLSIYKRYWDDAPDDINKINLRGDYNLVLSRYENRYILFFNENEDVRYDWIEFTDGDYTHHLNVLTTCLVLKSKL